MGGARIAFRTSAMDIATGLGLIGGVIVVSTVILMGGNFGMYFSDHALIIIFGGSFSATLIRFPLVSIFHGLPLGAKFAFTMRHTSQRELVDQVAQLAEVARKSGPIGLEKIEVEKDSEPGKARLYYLRNRTGKAAMAVKEKRYEEAAAAKA